MGTEISIKGMVCQRCIAVIEGGIRELGYKPDQISLGKLSFNTALDTNAIKRIEDLLTVNGFALISNRQVKIVKQVKDIIDEIFLKDGRHHNKVKFSSLLPERLHMNYDSVSELFASTEGITLEKYIIAKRLERVKELLVYTKLTLTEIAFITGFSSLNHLSRQFKQLTGLSPSHFKAIKKTKQTVSGQTLKGKR